jgi:hypothetical protein
MSIPVQLGVSVATKAINGEEFIGTVIAVDRYGFAVVDFGVSHARIAVTELKVVA